MSLKKMLGIISVIIIVVFSMMLSTSYAWYAFENASTTFGGVTNNDDVIISYQHGEYINTTIAVPITSDQIVKYSDKNNFNIKVKNRAVYNEIAVTVSLVEFSIAGALQDANFKIDLYHQGGLVGTLAGNQTSGITSYSFDAVVLDNYISNNFEVRVYLLDDGSNQSALMNKTFSAKVQVDVVSRLKTSKTDYSNTDIYVSSITIDGEASNSLPTVGYYDMTATCTKGSNLTWEPLSKTITYAAGSYINDSCSLAFTSSTDYPLLSEMPVGSYVKYVGSNGCDGKACEGYNANYVNESNKGYCGNDGWKFYSSGWRIGYIENGSAYLISAGAPECYEGQGYYDGFFETLDSLSLKYCNEDFIKNGVCDDTTVHAIDNNDFTKITGTDFYSCYNVVNRSCGQANALIDIGGQYWFVSNSTSLSYWASNNKYIMGPLSKITLGVRPIIHLDSLVVVVGGDGTYDNPYKISK